jgi:hypothetical protein
VTGAGSTQLLTGACRLREAVDAANTLLYHAVGAGQDLANTVRDPIIKARAAIDRGDALSQEDEGKFLDAYAKLALRSSPVTAATLEATSRRRGRPGWLGRLFGFQPASDAQRLVWYFGLLALCLIVFIAAGEWAHSFMLSLAAAEKQLTASSQELREANMRRDGIEDQIKMLRPGPGSAADAGSNGAVRQALETRRNEITVKIWALDQAVIELSDTVQQGYRMFERMFGSNRFQYTRGPLVIILGSFFLPLLYGALGTCAFVMRSLFREMVDRTFDGRRTGEFTVRIFLGMLSGITMQWLVTRSDGTVVSAVTPAVLAFVAGYSVEMLFSAMDRLVNLVTGRARSAHRPQSASSRIRTEPTETANGVVNGAGGGPRVTSPVATLATVRSE